MGAANFVSGFWEVIKEIWRWCEFITVLDPWEEGVQVRMGNFKRVVKGGWWLHMPATIDEFHTLNVRPTALELDEQALETGDKQEIVVKGVLMWSVFDIKKALLDVEDVEETLGDLALGIVQRYVEEQDYGYLQSDDCRKEIKREIQKQARKWGVTVSSFKWQSIVRARTYKLFGSP